MSIRYVIHSEKFGYYQPCGSELPYYTKDDFSTTKETAHWFKSEYQAKLKMVILSPLDNQLKIIPINVTIPTLNKIHGIALPE